MIRRPPRSPLFPSTTLSRSYFRQPPRLYGDPRRQLIFPITAAATAERDSGALGQPMRSEEHTSELQSLAYLVCRLLLEKKKKTSEVLSYPLHRTYLRACVAD